jgi:hypothetical protein
MIRHVIHDQSNPDLGDTIHFIQRFYNYYSYDDGTAELGYGLSIAQGKAAVRFTLNISDTLRGIAMFFNRVQNDLNDQFFNLKVWDNNNGKPGNVIWDQESLKPKFSNELNEYQIYEIDPPLNLIGTFFIGFEQKTNYLLNVGFDTHYDASENMFYNTDGTWQQSLMIGSLMMRPILYQYYNPFDIEEFSDENQWKIYPNPINTGVLHLENSRLDGTELQNSGTSISLYDMLGREMLRSAWSSTISTAHLPEGMYILHISNQDHSIQHVHKVLIN